MLSAWILTYTLAGTTYIEDMFDSQQECRADALGRQEAADDDRTKVYWSCRPYIPTQPEAPTNDDPISIVVEI
jgi:hypothetical protein